MVIDKNYRSKGFGTSLLLEAEKYAKDNGINNIELVSHKFSKAFNLYSKLGYKENNLIVMEKLI